MLNDIKQNYISIAGAKLPSVSSIDLVDKYFLANTRDKDYYLAQLILYCWPVLEKLFYKQTVKIMSEEECYDIFIDAFFYVIQHQVWKDENSSLYQDKDALLKAMYTTVESRRRNFFIAQNRQKRQVNQFPLSLDGLSDEFQEGYFSPVSDSYNLDNVSKLRDCLLYSIFFLSSGYISLPPSQRQFSASSKIVIFRKIQPSE